MFKKFTFLEQAKNELASEHLERMLKFNVVAYEVEKFLKEGFTFSEGFSITEHIPDKSKPLKKLNVHFNGVPFIFAHISFVAGMYEEKVKISLALLNPKGHHQKSIAERMYSVDDNQGKMEEIIKDLRKALIKTVKNHLKKGKLK